MSLSDPPQTRALDEATRVALVEAVEAAKARGWTQADLRAYFDGKGVALADYLKAKVAAAIPVETASVFVQVSITGLPNLPARVFEDPLPELPQGMKDAARWLLWRLEPNTDPSKKPRKVPYYVTGAHRSGALDTPEDRAQLASYEEAAGALAVGGDRYAGLGFALGPDETGKYWQGIDLDNLDQHPGLKFVAEDLPGYVERSPSGAGVHAIGYGRPFHSLGSNTTGIEAYAQGRYFTVTGEAVTLADLGCLADFVESRLAPLHTFRPQDTSASAVEAGGSLAGALAAADLRSALASMRSDERDLWIRMGHALKGLGDQGRGLWLEWSQTSPKYDPADASRTWESFKPERTGYQAVFAEAQRRGWVNTASRLAVQAASAAPATREIVDPETGEITEEEYDPRAWNLRHWTARAYEGKAPDIVWLCEGTIPLGAPVLFASMGGLGKSYMAIDLGLRVAVEVVAEISPRPVLGGQVVQTGTAVILSAEDSRDSIHRRLEMIDPDGRRHAHPDRLIIMPLPDAGGPRPLIASDGKALSMTQALHDLKAELLTIPDLKLIVIDPLQAFVLADVNADPAAGQFMWSAFASLCAETGATLIVAHHMRKDGATSIKTADDAREAIRGSTALVDGARLTYALWKAGTDEARDMCARLDVEYAPERIAFGAVVKANDQANREIQTYMRQASGLLTDATSKVAASKPVKGVSVSSAQQIIDEIGAAFSKAKAGQGEGYGASHHSGERYVVKLIMRRTGCTLSEAKDLIEGWIQNGIVESQMVNSSTKKMALCVLRRLA